MNKLKEANNNSFPAQRWMFAVYETPYKEMPYGVKAVAGVIALCAWGEKDKSFPSYEAISVALGGASTETIRNAVKKLEDFGFLAVSKVKTQAGNRNDYRLVFPNTSVVGSITSVAETNTSVSGHQSLHTGEAEALIETPKEATKEALTLLLTQPITTYNNDLGLLDEEIPNIKTLIPLDAFARSEHSNKATKDDLDDLWNAIETSTAHIDRALVRKDYANAKKRAWGVV